MRTTRSPLRGLWLGLLWLALSSVCTAAPTLVAVAGFVTIPDEPDSRTIGVGVGEELAERLAMQRWQVDSMDRLLVNNAILTAGVAPSMLVGGEGGPEQPAQWAKTLRNAPGVGYHPDYLIVGSVRTGDGCLVANTRLISVSTGAVDDSVRTQVPRTAQGIERDKQTLALSLTEEWCIRLKATLTPAMRQPVASSDAVYHAWCQAKDLLYRGQYRDCLACVAEAQLTGAEAEMLRRILDTRDQAYEMLILQSKLGTPERDQQLQEMLVQTGQTYDLWSGALAYTAFYRGLSEERAGLHDQALASFLECLSRHPGRIAWTGQAPPGASLILASETLGVVCCGRFMQAWYVDTGRPGKPVLLSSPVVREAAAGEMAFVCGRDGQLSAYHLPDGERRWVQSLPAPPAWLAAHGEVVLYQDSAGLLKALDAHQGKELWRAELPVVQTPPVWCGDLACLASVTGSLTVIDVRAGERAAGATSFGRAVRLLAAGCGKLMVGADSLLCLDLAKRVVDWQRAGRCDAAIIHNDTVLAALGNWTTACLTLDDGVVTWHTTPPNQASVAAATADPELAVCGDLVVADGGRGVLALQAGTGELAWRYDMHALLRGVVRAGRIALVIDADGRLRGLRTDPGATSDLAERATLGVMRELLHRGRSAEAVRWGARLLWESPSRSGEFRRLLGSALSGGPLAWSGTPTPEGLASAIWGPESGSLSRLGSGVALDDIMQASWTRDSLAKKIDALACLPPYDSAAGSESFAHDPAELCPPFVACTTATANGGTSAAAQVYFQIATALGEGNVARGYAQEALRLAPQWLEARLLVEELAAAQPR